MEFLYSWKERQAQLKELIAADKKGRPEIFDILIIGGGINGAAIARDASLRGLKVLLLEKNDFAWGTSSRSSKLIHGGVRYLEQFELKLVQESTRERAILWKQAPQLAHPLPFLFPAYKHSRLALWKLNLGLWLYDILALFRVPSLHRLYSGTKTHSEEPSLRTDGLRGSVFYWDASTNDAMITLANIKDSVRAGAQCFSRVVFREVEWSPLCSSSLEEGHLIHAHDFLENQSFKIRARCLISATGPWSNEVWGELGFPKKKWVTTTRGSHIVVPQTQLPVKHAVVMTHPLDGRVLFAIPWGTSTIVGTTDLFDESDPNLTQMSSEEVTYLLESIRYYFPEHSIDRNEIQSTWTGLRPLLAPDSNETGASQISREHLIEWNSKGVLLITGGKLTTHREMAEQCIDRLLKETQHWEASFGQPRLRPCQTANTPLYQFAELEGQLSDQILELDAKMLRTLCRTQMVLSLEDLMVRRTALFYKAPQNGLPQLNFLKPLLQEELSWNEDEWQKQVTHYQAYLKHHIHMPLKS